MSVFGPAFALVQTSRLGKLDASHRPCYSPSSSRTTAVQEYPIGLLSSHNFRFHSRACDLPGDVSNSGGVKVGFKVGQKVVYPNHGIGTIEQIEQKQIGATALPFYTLRLAATNTLVLVPVSNASEVGLRAPISSGECEMLFKALADDFASPANDWKDRFKEFSEKMRTGDIFEVAEVLN